jgi:polar amino acid transport system substrate-binding protein
LQSDPLGFIFPLGSDLVEPVNLALAEMAANGTLEELGRKYFTDAFTVTYDDIAPVGEEEDEASALPDLGGIEVTVGVENAYLPFNYIPIGETEGTGWDYEAWDAICELLNCIPVMTEAGWPAVIEEVAQGLLDTAADGISITAERAEIVDFSDSYMAVEQKLVARLDDDRYTSADDVLADPDARIGTQVGTTNYELAITLVPEGRVDAFDQFGLAIQALISGDVDAVIIDDAAGLGYVGENADQIVTLDGALQSDPLGFIFPLGSALVDPVNQALAVLKENGTLEELGRKYFTDSFTVTYDDIADVGGEG